MLTKIGINALELAHGVGKWQPRLPISTPLLAANTESLVGGSSPSGTGFRLKIIRVS